MTEKNCFFWFVVTSSLLLVIVDELDSIYLYKATKRLVFKLPSKAFFNIIHIELPPSACCVARVLQLM